MQEGRVAKSQELGEGGANERRRRQGCQAQDSMTKQVGGEEERQKQKLILPANQSA